jgi:hypothetical protein
MLATGDKRFRLYFKGKIREVVEYAVPFDAMSLNIGCNVIVTKIKLNTIASVTGHSD